jgi:hypothetical protein
VSLQHTLGNETWLRQNEAKLRALLPETWTHIENLNGLKLGFGLKLIGVDWRSPEEFGKVMLFLEKVGIIQRQNGYQVRANHRSIIENTERSGSDPK